MPIKRSSKNFENTVQDDSFRENVSVLGKFLKSDVLKTIVGIIVIVIVISRIVSNNKYKNTDEYKYQQAHNIYDVVDYNDAIIHNFNNNRTLENEYIDGDIFSAEGLDGCYKVVSLYQSGLNFLQNIGGWKNDRSFVDATIAYYEHHIAFYQDFCNFIKTKDDLSDDELIDKLTSFYAIADEEDVLSENVLSVQDKFAEKYGYTYTENGPYLNHFMDIYREYDDKDSYFIENREDWSDSKLVKEINNIITYNKELLTQAKNPPSRDGDKTLQEATINLLEKNIAFYEKLGYLIENASELSDDEYNKIKDDLGKIGDELEELKNKLFDADKEFRALYF